MGISNLTGKCLKSVKQSAISAHLLECNCSIEFDYFDILASDANKFRLLIKGALSGLRQFLATLKMMKNAF